MILLKNSMTLLQKLKSDTMPLHQRLESNPQLQLLTSPAITLPDYAHLLRLFYGFFAPLENQLNTYPELLDYLPDFTSRRKASLLLADIEKIEGHSPAIDNNILASDLPQISNLADAFGCLYEMEGSTLGGRFITKHLQATLGLEPGTGTSFFNGYGENTGARWSVFREAIQHFSSKLPGDEEIIRTANLTFTKLDTWFNQNG